MNRYEFHLHMSPKQCLDYYRGTIRHLNVRSTAGQLVQFPASRLQRYITTDGIHGFFALTCDENHKCTDLRRLDTIS